MKYKILNEEKSSTFLKKLASSRYIDLLFMKDLFLVKNFINRPSERDKYVSPLRVLMAGKNRFRVKLKERVFCAEWNLL
jgi:hypothetical protein